jgi:flagellar assembly protein FliH
MKQFRPYRFPPLAQFTTQRAAAAAAQGHAHGHGGDGGAQWAASVSEGFEQGQRDGYEIGLARGQEDGFEAGRGRPGAGPRGRPPRNPGGLRPAGAPGRRHAASLKKLRSDYRAAQRKEVVDLVAKVARQVIRAELALQPVQLLALVDETLASMPPTRDEIDVFLNPEELKRIAELDPKRAKRWNLIPDARLDAGECRIKAGDNEVDAGCHQRLAAAWNRSIINYSSPTAAMKRRSKSDRRCLRNLELGSVPVATRPAAWSAPPACCWRPWAPAHGPALPD